MKSDCPLGVGRRARVAIKLVTKGKGAVTLAWVDRVAWVINISSFKLVASEATGSFVI